MLLIELLEDLLMKRVIFLTVRIDLGNDGVEIGIGTERSLRDELLTACGTLFVARSQRRYDTLLTETVQTLFSRHCMLENVEANRTHELGLEFFRRHGDQPLVVVDLVRQPIELVLVELPGSRQSAATACTIVGVVRAVVVIRALVMH